MGRCKGVPKTTEIETLNRFRKALNAADRKADRVSKRLKNLLDRKKSAKEDYNRLQAKSIERFESEVEKFYSSTKTERARPRRQLSSPTSSELNKISLSSSDRIRISPWKNPVMPEPSDQSYLTVYQHETSRERGYAKVHASWPELQEALNCLRQCQTALVQAEQRHDAHRASYGSQFSTYARETGQKGTKKTQKAFSKVYLKRNRALVKEIRDAEFLAEQAHAKAISLGKENDYDQISNYGSVDDGVHTI